MTSIERRIEVHCPSCGRLAGEYRPGSDGRLLHCRCNRWLAIVVEHGTISVQAFDSRKEAERA